MGPEQLEIKERSEESAMEAMLVSSRDANAEHPTTMNGTRRDHKSQCCRLSNFVSRVRPQAPLPNAKAVWVFVA